MLADLAGILKLALLAWMALFFTLVLVLMLRGRINTTGLFSTEASRGRADPERVASFATSLFAIGAYAFEVLSSGLVYDPDTLTYVMPAPPETLLVLLAGANGAYLSGKLIRKVS